LGSNAKVKEKEKKYKEKKNCWTRVTPYRIRWCELMSTLSLWQWLKLFLLA